MAKKEKGMPETISLVHIKKNSKHTMPFKQATAVLKGQVGRPKHLVSFTIEEGFIFNGTDIVRDKDEK